jgi:hypothetical protein
LGSKGDYLKQQLKDKLIEHKHYVHEHGKDLPEILNWKWNHVAINRELIIKFKNNDTNSKKN